jgi:Contractile injection system tube protein
MAVASKGMLVEYGLSLPPLALIFDFNPQQISRSRSVTIRTGNAPGARLGYDFLTPLDAPRAAQGVELQGESISVTILLDATDKMLEGDAIAAQFGVQPQIDTLRSMLEPKVQGPGGLKVLSSLTGGGARAFERQETASVLIFAWGLQFLPVFLTGVSQNETMHLPSLHPYRAEMTLNMQVIESNNPFFLAEKVRQTAMTALNAVAFVGRLG